MLQYFTQANEYFSKKRHTKRYVGFAFQLIPLDLCYHIDKLIVITFYKSKVFFCKYEVGGKNTLPHFIN